MQWAQSGKKKKKVTKIKSNQWGIRFAKPLNFKQAKNYHFLFSAISLHPNRPQEFVQMTSTKTMYYQQQKIS